VIVLLHRSTGGSISADVVFYGMYEADTGPEPAWFVPNEGVWDWVKDQEANLLGWFPVPQIDEWMRRD